MAPVNTVRTGEEHLGHSNVARFAVTNEIGAASGRAISINYSGEWLPNAKDLFWKGLHEDERGGGQGFSRDCRSELTLPTAGQRTQAFPTAVGPAFRTINIS